MHALARFFVSGLAALGFAVAVWVALAWWARDDLVAWYQHLPVAIYVKCPGASR